MNLAFIDWMIVLGSFLLICIPVVLTRKLMRGVTDFLAAGRTAGRYMMTVSSGLAGLGAITIVAFLEMNLHAGFSQAWWGLTMAVVVLVIKVTGWVVYRFRQSRCLTLPQFFELRYSRRFRIFTGLLAFLSGLINFGIFPAVGARFFIYFCGLPHSFGVLGITVSTFPLVMIVLLSIALYFVFVGGQVAVLVTDFIQGAFVNLTFVVLVAYMLFSYDWGHIGEALLIAPPDASMINPYKTGNMRDFNFWYFLIGVLIVFYNCMSWQGAQAYNASAKTAHEAKMGGVLEGWRGMPWTLMTLFIPMVAFMVLTHPDYAHIADQVNLTLAGIDSEAVQNQLKVPLVLSHLLPRGLIGAFAAVMLAAFISTHDTYLHSWGSILVQDVIMPFRGKPFTPKGHLLALRISICGVAVFIFFFSLLFQQSQFIFMFFAITGAIFAGGSGAVIIGGLYWKRGTNAAAWAAMITGSSIAVGGIIIHQLVDDFWINGQVFTAISIGGASVVYVVVSLLSSRPPVDLDQILRRGAYAIRGEMKVVDEVPQRGWRMLGIGREFTRGDKFIYLLNYGWNFLWVSTFIAGTIYNLTHDVSNQAWLKFWRFYVYIHLIAAGLSFFWITIGGGFDLRSMIRSLKTMERDDGDDGFIHQSETAVPTE